jgi:toxin ParE1/3/4
MIRRTPAAEADILEIAAYIAQDDVEAAYRFIDRIDAQCWMLAQSPYIGRNREELMPGLRSFPVGNYLIYHQPLQDGIEVVRVLHGARDIEPLFP